MKKSLYLAFIAALALSMGCIVTGYPVITDSSVDGPAYVVNTNGWANINETNQFAVTWPDGTRAATFSMIDQKFDGTGQIRTYTVYGPPEGAGQWYIGNTYCSPDWNGCSFALADNALDFEYTYTFNCEGINAVLYLYYYDLRIGECGRGLGRFEPGLTNAITGSFVNLGDAWGLNLNRSNTRLIGEDSQGHSFQMPLFGNTQLALQKDGSHWTAELHNGLLPTFRAQARVTEEFDVNKWTVEYLGHSRIVNAKFRSQAAAEFAGF